MVDGVELREVDVLPRVATWCLGLGGVLAALGILSIAAPWAASTVIDYLCGGTLIAAGASQLAAAAGTWTWRGFWLVLVCGALSIVAGAAMLAIPVEGIHALVTFLGIVILLESAAKLTAAFSVPREFPRGWLLFDGILTAVLGGILLTSPAGQAGVYLGVLVGINLLSSGISTAAAGLWLRRSAA
jgi:uncharacterized membrane protein HdeD (DUF308 family)